MQHRKDRIAFCCERQDYTTIEIQVTVALTTTVNTATSRTQKKQPLDTPIKIHFLSNECKNVKNAQLGIL